MVLTNEQFLVAYMEAYRAGETVTELAATLGVRPGYCYLKASSLRRRGLRIPDVTRRPHTKPVDMQSLQNLVDELSAVEMGD